MRHQEGGGRRMTPERWVKVKGVFERLRQTAPSERPALLTELCAEDVELRNEVQSLLSHMDAADEFLTQDSGPSPEAFLISSADRKGESLSRVGRYRVLSVAGQGGMGIVYLAEQETPRRQVALKVLHGGRLSAHLRQRFEHETAILARLNHPGIAQIFEAGVEGDGPDARPWFAMELVRGVPLTEYAASRRLPLHDRLRLMIRVCDAVHHAHQKGVIHRDLKPGNILVNEQGLPKILDFGVARMTDAQSRTLITQPGQLVGTLQYMSPEQVAGDIQDLDIRSDVYALGVILYELIEERLPYDLSRVSLREGMRLIQEQEPSRLEAAPPAARAELSAVVGRATEKDRARRYQSALDLKADLERFLAHQPVLAHPPGRLYAFRKFARRNRALVGGVTAAIIILLVGVATTTWQAHVATKRWKLVQAGIERADNMYAFFSGLLTAIQPDNARGRDTALLRDVVARAAANVETAFPQDPDVRAAVYTTLGITHQKIGAYDLAEQEFRAALKMREQLLGPDHAQIIESLNNLAVTLRCLDRGAESRALLERALSMDARLGRPDPAMRPRLLWRLAELRLDEGAPNEAEPLLREAMTYYQQTIPAPLIPATACQTVMARLKKERFEFNDAERLAWSALRQYRGVLGPDHSGCVPILAELTSILMERGDYPRALETAEEGWQIARKTFGLEHDLTVSMTHLKGACVRLVGRYAEAIDLAHQTVEAARRQNAGAQRLATYLTGLAQARLETDQVEDAPLSAQGSAKLCFAQEALGLLRSVPDANDHLARTLIVAAESALARGEVEQAQTFGHEALTLWKNRFGDVHPAVARAMLTQARIHLRRDDIPTAESFCRNAVMILRNRLAAEHPEVAAAHIAFARVLIAGKRHAEAEALLQESITVLSPALSADHPWVAEAESLLGEARLGLGRPDEAEPLLRSAHEKLRAARGEMDWRTAEARSRLDALHWNLATQTVP